MSFKIFLRTVLCLSVLSTMISLPLETRAICSDRIAIVLAGIDTQSSQVASTFNDVISQVFRQSGIPGRRLPLAISIQL